MYMHVCVYIYIYIYNDDCGRFAVESRNWEGGVALLRHGARLPYIMMIIIVMTIAAWGLVNSPLMSLSPKHDFI